MVLLIHHPVSAHSRKIRMIMAEKGMLFVLREEELWNLSEDVKRLNPAGELPIFIFDGNVISGNYAITEYLEEAYPTPELMPKNLKERAEVRRISDWFDIKFQKEVYQYILSEKIFKRFGKQSTPNSKILNAGYSNLNYHMQYLDWLSERNNYLAGDKFSIADASAAAQISVIDYLGDVSWNDFPNAKIWYAKVKSRPSFKDILKDNIRGILPSKHYTNLDF